jgi:pyruvate, orthophosphate dikinase
MEGFPVTIRLLDPPLHEFLPREETEIEALAARWASTPPPSATRSRAWRR